MERINVNRKIDGGDLTVGSGWTDQNS
jgi:hypothetical protein